MSGAVVVVPAVGYVCLLLNSVLGGPTIYSPNLSLSDPPAPAAAAVVRHFQPPATRSSAAVPAKPLVVDPVSTWHDGRPSLTVATQSRRETLTPTLTAKDQPTRSTPAKVQPPATTPAKVQPSAATPAKVQPSAATTAKHQPRKQWTRTSTAKDQPRRHRTRTSTGKHQPRKQWTPKHRSVNVSQ